MVSDQWNGLAGQDGISEDSQYFTSYVPSIAYFNPFSHGKQFYADEERSVSGAKRRIYFDGNLQGTAAEKSTLSACDEKRTSPVYDFFLRADGRTALWLDDCGGCLWMEGDGHVDVQCGSEQRFSYSTVLFPLVGSLCRCQQSCQ